MENNLELLENCVGGGLVELDVTPYKEALEEAFDKEEVAAMGERMVFRVYGKEEGWLVHCRAYTAVIGKESGEMVRVKRMKQRESGKKVFMDERLKIVENVIVEEIEMPAERFNTRMDTRMESEETKDAVKVEVDYRMIADKIMYELVSLSDAEGRMKDGEAKCVAGKVREMTGSVKLTAAMLLDVCREAAELFKKDSTVLMLDTPPYVVLSSCVSAVDMINAKRFWLDTNSPFRPDTWVFLGSFLDGARDEKHFLVLMWLLAKKCLHPDKIFLLRGKDELATDFEFAAESLSSVVQGFSMDEFKRVLLEVFASLPLAAEITSENGAVKAFCSHGFCPAEPRHIEELRTMDTNTRAGITGDCDLTPIVGPVLGQGRGPDGFLEAAGFNFSIHSHFEGQQGQTERTYIVHSCADGGTMAIIFHRDGRIVTVKGGNAPH